MALKQETLLMQNGFDIGIGVAMASGSPMALGAVGDVTPPRVGPGGSGSFTFKRLETTEELENELGVGVDVAGGIGLFRASASFDFSKKCKVQSSSLCVMVSAERSFAFQQMDSPRLSDEAAAFIANGNVTRFAEQFGDYFVRGISTGGRFVGVVRIETNSAQSKTDIDIALSGSYGLTVSGNVRVEIAEAMKKASGRAEAFLTFEGGEVRTNPTSKDPLALIGELYQAMDEWTASVRGDPKAYSVTVAPYALALGPAPPNLAELEQQRDVLIRCAKLRARVLDNLNLVDYMLDPDHRAEFEVMPPPGGPDLSELQAALARDLDVIAETASFAINNVKQAKSPEEFMRDIKQVPDFRFTVLPRLPLHTGRPAPLPAPVPAVPVTSLVGVDLSDIDFARASGARTVGEFHAQIQLAGGTVTPFQMATITQPVLDFVFSDLVFRQVPDPPDLFDDPVLAQGRKEIGEQVPSSGTVAHGATVVLRIVPVP
jgi:hypothetical protein